MSSWWCLEDAARAYFQTRSAGHGQEMHGTVLRAAFWRAFIKEDNEAILGPDPNRTQQLIQTVRTRKQSKP